MRWSKVRFSLNQFFWCFKKADQAVKAIEPWGILLAVIGLAVSIYAFQIDYQDRTVERKLRAWEIITTEGPINGGKREALEFLLKDGDLSAAKISRAELAGRNLSHFSFQNADLRKAYLAEANLKRANFERADLGGADFNSANLAGAYLMAADLEGANLQLANLEGAELFGADLSKAGLFGANLEGANLHAANLQGVSFLNQKQLDKACGDEETKLPEGLTIPVCAAKPVAVPR